MQNYSENYNLSKKNWRAIAYDWDTISSYGQKTCLYCLTDFQAAWLLANVPYMGWSTRWVNCPCTDDELKAMAAELEYNLMSCFDLDTNQLEYIYSQQVAQQLQALQDAWDISNTPSDVNPNTPDDFFSGNGSDERLDALCTAITLYVYSYANTWINKAQILLGVAVAFGILASVSIVGGIIASVVIGGLFYISQVALNAMSNIDVLDDIICCMNDAMIGTAITPANFESSLDSCGFTVGTDQAIVRDIIASDLGQLGNFLSFINSIGDSFEYAENGIVLCNCGVGMDILVTFDSLSTVDFTVGENTSFLSGYTILRASEIQSVLNGNPIPAFRMAFIRNNSNGFEGVRGLARVDLGAEYTINSASFEYYYDKPSAASNVLARSIQFRDGSLTPLGGTSTSANDAITDSWTQFNDTGAPYANCRYIDVSLSINGSSAVYDPSNTDAWIDNIRANIEL